MVALPYLVHGYIPREPATVWRNLHHIIYIDYFMEHRRDEQSVGYVLKPVQNCEARDPRDRVFAQRELLHRHVTHYEDILGRPCESLPFHSAEPDCVKPVRIPFTKVALYLLDVEGPDVLAYVEHTAEALEDEHSVQDNEEGLQYLPSWVVRPRIHGTLPSSPSNLDPDIGAILLTLRKLENVRLPTDGGLWTLGLRDYVQDIVSSVSAVEDSDEEQLRVVRDVLYQLRLAVGP